MDARSSSGILVVCRSARRREKELAIDLQGQGTLPRRQHATLRGRIVNDWLKDTARIERAIGRLRKKHPRVARFFTLRHEPGRLAVTRDVGKFWQAEFPMRRRLVKS